MVRAQRGPSLVLGSAFVLLQCMPDFDSLNAGRAARGGGSGAGSLGATGGSSARGGAATGGSGGADKVVGGSAGTALAGAGMANASGASAQGARNGGGGQPPSAGGTGAETGAAGIGEGGAAGEPTSTGGTAGTDGPAGTGGAGGAGGTGGTAGKAGAGGAACTPLHRTASVFDDFDVNLDGPGIANATISVNVDTTQGTTCSMVRDSSVGTPCPGSLHLAANFKAYVSGSAADEIVYGDLNFADASWTGATALHAMVKVSPMNAPLASVEFYLISGSFLFVGATDPAAFKNGDWNEIVVPLASGGSFDATKVFRLGFRLRLARAGTSGIPTQVPVIDAWLDDVWLETQ